MATSEWLTNLIKTNKQRQKDGEVYKGPLNVGNTLVDGSVVKASDLGAEKATEVPFKSKETWGPMNEIELDRMKTLVGADSFKQPEVQNDDGTVTPAKDITPTNMILNPKVEGQPRTYKDGSRNKKDYAKYLFGDRFTDEQLAAALNYVEHPDDLRSPETMKVIKSVIPDAEYNPSSTAVGAMASPESLKTNMYINDVVGDGFNILDNAMGKLANAGKWVRGKVQGEGDDPEMEIITKGKDPKDAKGKRYTVDDLSYYFQMPNGKAYTDTDITNRTIDKKTGEVILPDGTRLDPAEFNKAAAVENAYSALPDGTRLTDGEYSLRQKNRGFGLLTQNPKSPLQDAQGKFPDDPGYNLFDNFTDAGWTETVPFLTDTLLQSAPRMVNPYAAGGLMLNDMSKTAIGMDTDSMKPADGWDFLSSPTYEPSAMDEKDRAKRMVMHGVEAGTEYLLPTVGKLIGKGGTAAMKGVGGDFLSNAIESRLPGISGKALSGFITEGPVEEGTTALVQSILSKFLTPSSYGVRDPKQRPDSETQKLVKEGSDLLTASIAGGLSGAGMNSTGAILSKLRGPSEFRPLPLQPDPVPEPNEKTYGKDKKKKYKGAKVKKQKKIPRTLGTNDDYKEGR